ncbi:SGNH/GDSL hydrolase family protein [Curtobacterium sp. YC1]|uniref:SGNH/GDSL hydrolase family protein n=1 Tax=Curtobacterium sp. YC1 TaxID=2795488 RepID=UPI0018E55D71|nr:SGNH/GDSL hydrolase family protein [Curtobacterium sp. YC1]QQD76918.1 SGNH/GDSL hydrolase family protein [Curtobacterium sp. YC1]
MSTNPQPWEPNSGTRDMPEVGPHIRLSSWVDSRIATADAPPPASDIPAISWSSSDVTALTSPVAFKPAVCGIGTRTTSWDGLSDTVFRYEPGVFETDAGGGRDYALYGAFKPGGEAQFARWPLGISFLTGTSNSVVEVAFYSKETNNAVRVEINGRFISDAMNYTTQPSNSGKLTLTFPTAAARSIRIWAFGTLGVALVRVPTGQSLTQPPAPKRCIALLGDSYLNGSGSTMPYASTVDQTTFGVRLARYMGADAIMLAGVGGTGIEAGATSIPTSNYAARAAIINARAPQVLIINASINDGASAGTLQASTTSLLQQFPNIREVYIVGGFRSEYRDNYRAVRAAVEGAWKNYLDLGEPLFGSGRLGSPNGSGTNDYWLLEDGAHPSADAHVAMARGAFRAYARMILGSRALFNARPCRHAADCFMASAQSGPDTTARASR